MKMKINHPLMRTNFKKSDMDAVRNLIKNRNLILTQSKKVQEFEQSGQNGLMLKYSVFVNSGSSANFISMLICEKFIEYK